MHGHLYYADNRGIDSEGRDDPTPTFVLTELPVSFPRLYLAGGVTTGGACPKLARNAGDSLGSLDTTGLQAGSYTAKLEVFLGGTPTLVAPMSFTLQ